MSSRIDSRTYGTVSAEKQKEMTGREFVQRLANGTLPLNTIAKTLGYDIAEAESGRVVVTAEPKDIHLNPAGSVHGGLAATVLDSCMGLAIQSTLEKGVGSTTLGQSDGLDGGFCVPTKSSATAPQSLGGLTI